jgi:hypothetical protein
MTRDEAVLEVGWVAREAREIVAATPHSGSTDEYWVAWQARWDAYMARKDALLAYIEATNRKAQS